MNHRLGLGVFTLFIAGCYNHPLAPRSIVSSPRILAIIADAPEIGPGEFTELRTITGGLAPDTTTSFRWFVCARPEATTTFTAESTFGVASPDEGCFGDAAVAIGPTGNGERFMFAVPGDIFQRLEALRAVYGSAISTAALQHVVSVAGLPITIAVEMSSGATVVRGIKRVVVSTRAQRDQNPPGPSFRWGVSGDGGTGGVHLSQALNEIDVCVADSNAALTARPGEAIQLAPDATESAWLTSYQTLDSNGDVTTAQETAFYSWYSTDGWFEGDRTNIPLRNTVFHAPFTAGAYSVWLMVRDGRGGTAGCRVRFRVM